MKKKIYISLLILLVVSVFSFSFTYATDNTTIVDGIRNVVGGAENTLENAGNGVVSGIRNVTSAGQNMMENTADNIGNGVQNVGAGISGALDMDNTDYTATRTATETSGNFLGMDPTMWTWLVMAVVGGAIIALVWTYAKQNDRSYNE